MRCACAPGMVVQVSVHLHQCWGAMCALRLSILHTVGWANTHCGSALLQCHLQTLPLCNCFCQSRGHDPTMVAATSPFCKAHIWSHSLFQTQYHRFGCCRACRIVGCVAASGLALHIMSPTSMLVAGSCCMREAVEASFGTYRWLLLALLRLSLSYSSLSLSHSLSPAVTGTPAMDSHLLVTRAMGVAIVCGSGAAGAAIAPHPARVTHIYRNVTGVF